MYATMGLRLTYYPEDDTVDIEARPDACTQVRVGGGTCPLATCSAVLDLSS